MHQAQEWPWASVKRMLVARLDNISDVCLCTPAFAAIRASLLRVHLTLLASPGGANLAPLLADVDEVLAERVVWQDVGGRQALDPEREWRLVERLRKGSFAAAVIFTSFSQSPYPLAFLLRLAGVPLRAGQSKESDPGPLTHEVPAPPDALHQAERNLHLVERIGFPAASRSLSQRVPVQARFSAAARLSALGLGEGQPFGLLHAGASCTSRMYDPARYGRAARLLKERLGLTSLLTGDARDASQVAKVREVAGDAAVSLVGQTTLEEFAALIERAAVVLTNNTSTMHFADALRTPEVVLFAGTELEEQWRPRDTRRRLLRRPTFCSPCYAFVCPYDMECLDIDPEQVFASARELLEGSNTPDWRRHLSQ